MDCKFSFYLLYLSNRALFRVYIASSEHLGGGAGRGAWGLGKFSKVMQNLDYVLGLHNCLEFCQPPYVWTRLWKNGKSALLLKYRQQN